MASKLTRLEPATITLTIDGKQLQGSKGMTVLQVARQNGIYIPHLCDYEWLTPFSGCRVCLVEIEGRRGLDTSCTITASEGMVVRTDTAAVKEMQRGVMESLLSEHPDRCLTCPREDRCPPNVVCQRDNIVTDRCVLCPQNKQCELQRVVDFVGIRWNRLGEGRRPPKPERSNPFIDRNESYCIYCARCVRACDEIRGIFAFGLSYRGPHTRISVDFDKPLTESPCNFCGTCAIVCPTGALIKRDSTYGRIPNAAVASVCPHCGDGCSYYLNLRNGRIVNVLPDVSAPHNQGQLCVRGQFAYDFPYAEDRLVEPLLRGPDGGLHSASWDGALDFVAAKLVDLRARYGPDAIGVISSDHCSNEESYLVQKFARAVIGTNNVDQIGRLRQAASVETLLATLGRNGATNPIADIALAGCVLVAGSSTVESHEITALRIKKAARNGAKVIVIDPRRTSLERFAYLYLQPRVGTDLALLNGLLFVIVSEGLFDQAYVDQHCLGLDELRVALADYTSERVSKLTQVPPADIVAAARIFASGGADSRYSIPASWLGTLVDPGARPATNASCVVYGTGITQQHAGSGVVRAIVNLALLTANLGKLGGGLYPRVDEHNQQGATDMGVWPDLLPGYRRVDDRVSRLWFGEHWGVEPPGRRGLTLLEMLEAARNGEVRALYLVGANPLLSLPDQGYVRDCLANLDLLVVQELFPTDTVKMAHAVLPASSYAEKEGTYTNGERRIQLSSPAIAPVGSSRPDWHILVDLATRCMARPNGPARIAFDYPNPQSIMTEIAALLHSHCGISYARLRSGGLQWPCPDSHHPGTEALFVKGFPQGKVVLVPAAFDESQAAPAADSKYPLQLIAGREIYHSNTGTRTHRSKHTGGFRQSAHIELPPSEIERLGLCAGDLVRIVSETAVVQGHVEPNDSVPPGTAFLPIHYPLSPAYALFPWPKRTDISGIQVNAVPVRIEKA